MFSVACGNWNNSTNAGVFNRNFNNNRSNSNNNYGFRASDYIFKPQISGEKSGEIGVTFPVGKTTKSAKSVTTENSHSYNYFLNINNLYDAYLSARKHKRSKKAIFEFEKNLGLNLYSLKKELEDLFTQLEEAEAIEEKSKEDYVKIVDLFKKYGFRDNRNKNRMCYFLDEIGLEEFEKAIIKTSNLDLQSAGTLLVKDEYFINETSTIKLKDDKTAIYFSIPAGIFNAEDLENLSFLMEKTDSILRLTYEQSFFIITNDKNVDLIKNSLIYKKYDSFHNIYFNNLIACAGTNECSFGVIPNKADAIEMALYLNSHIPISNAKVRMYWSACPKGCGVHGVADIGFQGVKAMDENGNFCNGVKIFLGGKASNSISEARQITKAITMPKAQEVTKELLNIYKTEKLENESFESFDSRYLSTLSVEQIQEKIGL